MTKRILSLDLTNGGGDDDGSQTKGKWELLVERINKTDITLMSSLILCSKEFFGLLSKTCQALFMVVVQKCARFRVRNRVFQNPHSLMHLIRCVTQEKDCFTRENVYFLLRLIDRITSNSEPSSSNRTRIRSIEPSDKCERVYLFLRKTHCLIRLVDLPNVTSYDLPNEKIADLNTLNEVQKYVIDTAQLPWRYAAVYTLFEDLLSKRSPLKKDPVRKMVINAKHIYNHANQVLRDHMIYIKSSSNHSAFKIAFTYLVDLNRAYWLPCGEALGRFSRVHELDNEPDGDVERNPLVQMKIAGEFLKGVPGRMRIY